MFDLRPVGYVVGLLVAVLGVAMLFPMLIDFSRGSDNWYAFLQSAIISVAFGGLTALACANSLGEKLSIQQTFMLTTAVWIALPVFGALPFVFGIPNASYVDAFFEAMSGLTTTGSTVFVGLSDLPAGVLFWRGLLQWIGGIGIIVVAMVFLPELRVGGMQIFRSEGFETDGKILPRATEISSRISVIYFGLTIICAFFYAGLGMNPFDATVHAMTTIATGGFANYDASFGAFGPGVEYAAAVFMLLAALPFVRYVQILSGNTGSMFADPQVRGFIMTSASFVLLVVLWRWLDSGVLGEETFRRSLFNIVSILTGTGYASEDYTLWGSFPVAVFFFVGLVGGCAGSTSCSVKIFRYQLLISSIKAQIQQIHSPHGLFAPRYAGKPVSEEVLSSVMGFLVVFVVTLGVVTVMLALTGLDLVTAVSGASATLANIGPGLGDTIGPSGNYASLNDASKWVLAGSMLIGRLELLAVFVLFTFTFWRA